jgi:hypothetical protein
MKKWTFTAVAAIGALILGVFANVPATQANEAIPESVRQCVAAQLGPDVAQQLLTLQPTAEQEAVIRACYRQSGAREPGPGGPGMTVSGKCASSKGLKRYVKNLRSPNRLGVNIGQYPYSPGAFFYSPTTLAQDGYRSVRYTMQLYYDGNTGRLLHGKGEGELSLDLGEWLCSHSDEIREAKRAGLAVALFVEVLNWTSVQESMNGSGPPNFDHPDGIERRLRKEYLKAMPQIARFAEKYKVDWFDPANEADKGFTARNAAAIVKAVPKRTKRYKGLLVTQPLVSTYQEAGIVPDWSGYDLVSLHDGDILRTAVDYERNGQLPPNAFEQSRVAWQWAQAAGVKRYLVGEIGQFDAVSPQPSVEATAAVVDAYLAEFANPQTFLCQDNPDASMDRFETSPMNPVCKSLQSRFP